MSLLRTFVDSAAIDRYRAATGDDRSIGHICTQLLHDVANKQHPKNHMLKEQTTCQNKPKQQ